MYENEEIHYFLIKNKIILFVTAPGSHFGTTGQRVLLLILILQALMHMLIMMLMMVTLLMGMLLPTQIMMVTLLPDMLFLLTLLS